MKLLKLKLYNAKGIWKGIKQKEIEIDFTKFTDDIVIIMGKSGSGKSTILNNLRPHRNCGKFEDKELTMKESFYDGGYRELEFEFRGNKYLSKVYTGEAYLFKNDDEEPLNDGKVSTYDEWVEKEICKQEIYDTLLFAGVKTKNIFNLKKGERKDLFIEYLLDHLKKYSVKSALLQKEQDELFEKRKKLSIKLEEKEELSDKLSSLQEELCTVSDTLNKYNSALQTLKDTQELYIKQEEKNKIIIDEINELKSKRRETNVLYESKKKEYDLIVLKYDKAKKEYKDLKDKIVEMDAPEYDIDYWQKLIDDDNKNISEIMIKHQKEENDLQNKKDKIKELVKRIATLSTKADLPCDSILQKKCIMTNYNDYKGMLEELEKELDEKQLEVNNFSLEVPDVTELKQNLQKYGNEIKKINAYNTNKANYDRIEDLKVTGSELKESKTSLEKEVAGYKTKLDEIDVNIDTLNGTLNDEYVNYNDLISEKEKDIIRYTEKEKSIANSQKELKNKLDKLVDYQEQIDSLDKDISEYNLLLEFYSKNGAMIYEIEMAGVEVSKIANELLRNYEYKKMEVRFDTLKESSDGKKLLEVFDIKVSIDGDDWQTYLSGGEGILASNSIREAMSYIKQNKEFKTCFVDESDGELDADARIAFVKLLKEGNKLNDREKTFVISHSENVQGYIQQSIILQDDKLILNY